jgi:hypothetical protein
MPFEIKASPELAAIEVRLWDKLSTAELRSLVASVVELANAAGLRQALVDCRDYLGGAGLREVASLALDVTDRPVSDRGPEAFIAPANAGTARDVEFYIRAACRAWNGSQNVPFAGSSD